MSSFTSVSTQGPAGDAAAEPGPGEAPRDPHQNPQGNLAEFLRNQTADAVATLGQLVRLGPQSLPQDRLGQPGGLLPVTALQACQAIMFMQTTKGGLGLSYSHGSGFLINKLNINYDSSGDEIYQRRSGNGDGRDAANVAAGGGSWGGGYGAPVGGRTSEVPFIRWSAPCFYNIDSLSVGLTVGIEHTHSVLLLWNASTLERVKAGRAVLGTDVHVMMGQRAEAEDASGDPAGGDPGGPHLGLSGVGGGGGGLLGGGGLVGSGGLVGGLSLGGIELPLPQTRHAHVPHPQPHKYTKDQPPPHEEEGTTHSHRLDQAEDLLRAGEWQLREDEEDQDRKQVRQQQEKEKMRHHGGLMRLRQRAPAGPSPDEEEEEEEDRWAEAVGTASTARTTISTYTVHDGALLDFSLLGGALHPDKRHIRAVYGEGITPDDILYGRVQPPEEFGPLYSTLRMLTAKTRQQLAAL